MSPLLISYLFAIPTLLAALLSQITLWQRKEYRLDRMYSYAASPEGSIMAQPFLLAGYAAVALGWISYLLAWEGMAHYAGWVALLSIGTHHAERILRQGVWRPQWTEKAIILGGTLTLFTYFFIQFAFIDASIAPLQWATVLFFLPILGAVATYLVNIPFDIKKRQIIREAMEIRKKRKNLTVIGVTGSMGKTSTKSFIRQLMARPRKIAIETHERRNSDLAVAFDIKERLNANVHAYIVEMGAYRRGEIADLVQIAQPSIGIITAIDVQHLALFGSKDHIARAKWELIDGLPDSGIAVLNADDPILQERGQKTEKKIIWYSIKKEANVWASDITINPDTITATLHIYGSKNPVTIPLVSKGLLSNAVGAAAVAVAADIPVENIIRNLEQLQAPKGSMALHKTSAGATIIDDSYSNGRAATINAIEHLSTLSQPHKRIIFVPIIELGEAGSDIHAKLGEKMGEVSSDIILYGKAYAREIRAGVQKKNPKARVRIIASDPKKLLQAAMERVTEKSAILIKGRLPGNARKAIISM